MKDALTLAWSRAKAEMALHVRVEADRARLAANPVFPPMPAARPMQHAAYRKPYAVSGSRAFSHSW